MDRWLSSFGVALNNARKVLKDKISVAFFLTREGGT